MTMTMTMVTMMLIVMKDNYLGCGGVVTITNAAVDVGFCRGEPEILEALAKHKSNFVNSQNHRNMSCLHLAVIKQFPKCLQVLLKYDADVNLHASSSIVKCLFRWQTCIVCRCIFIMHACILCCIWLHK